MSTTKKYQVGEEITSVCTKCKLALDHTIAAMVGERVAKVQCKTCGGLHRYVNPAATESPARKAAKQTKLEHAWEALIQSSSSKKKQPYTFAGPFKQNDLIDHAQFGLGVVTERLSWDKIQVTFKEGQKILLSKRKVQ
jgi:hypothetical protein